MKKFIHYVLFLLPQFSFSQFIDDFNDGDFNFNPTWSGDDSVWMVDNGQLRSNSLTISNKFYLSTISPKATDAQWEFLVNLKFNTSSTNYVDVVLISDNFNLKNNFNGYFVRIGNTSDEISLYRRDGSTILKIIDGVDGKTNFSNNTLKMKVTRSGTNMWALRTDESGTGNNYVLEGTATDATYLLGNYFGIVVQQSTSSFFQKHFFDIFYVGNIILDLIPPVINSIDVVSQNQVDIYFSESVEQNSAETILNYFVNNGIGNPNSSVRDVLNFSLVHLIFSSSFSLDIANILTVNNVEDLNNNPASNISKQFTYKIIQVIDSFSDGDFINNPTWGGEESVWIIDNGKLRSNSLTINNNFFLSIPSSMSLDAQWEWWMNLKFNTSSSNYTDVVLISDKEEVKNNFNGYFVRIGNSNDEISLYRKDGNGIVKMIDGADGITNFSNNILKIKVRRNNSGDWILARDITGTGANYFTEGITNDLTYTSCKFFGILVVQSTASFFQKHYFDNISVITAVPDTVPPNIRSLNVISPNQLDIYFTEDVEQISTQSPANYIVNNGIGNPTSVVIDAFDFSLVHLSFSTSFALGLNHTVVLNNIKDLSGNPNTNVMDTFTYRIIEVADNFSDGDFTNNPIWNGDDSIWVIENGILRSSSMTTSNKFYLSTPSTMSLDAQWEWSMNLTFNTSGTNYVDVVLTSNNSNLKNNFNGYFVRIGNTKDEICLYRKDGANIIKIIDGSDGMTNSSNNNLRIKVKCTSSGDWILFRDITGTGKNYFKEGTVNDLTYLSSSFFGIVVRQSTASFFKKHYFDNINVTPIIIDSIPPAIASINVYSSSQLDVYFSESIEQNSAEEILNYSVNNGIGNPSAAALDSLDTKLVHLTFLTPFTLGQYYTLNVDSIQDESENISLNDSVVFVYYLVQPNDIVINEIYPDPSSPVGLPESEFVELYNRTPYPLLLKDWTFTDGSTNGLLSSIILPPDNFLILCPPGNEFLFSPFGRTLGLPKWPSLNNSGDNLTLNDDKGNVIFHVQYSNIWFQDVTKMNGGWTLELINPDNFCYGESNWHASMDGIGGTPGRKNSVYGMSWDTTAPTIANIQILSANSIRIFFNEEIDTSGSSATSNYFIDNGIGIPDSILFADDLIFAQLFFSTFLDTNKIYMLTISAIKDCIGNVVMNSQITFAIPVSAERYDILINEIMADPNPPIGLPDEEFVELYNHSPKAIDLNGYQLTDGKTIGILPSYLLLPDSFIILTSNNGVQYFLQYGKVLGLSLFPGLNNAGETLTIFDYSGKMIHSVDYDDNWYRDNVKKEGGWTLELIDPNSPCEGANNWRESRDISGGTPARINSVYGNNPDNIAPTLLKAIVIAKDTIQLTFSENINDLFVVNIDNFIIDNNIGKPKSVMNVFAKYNSVLLKLNDSLQHKIIYTITVRGLKDCAGNTIGLNNSVKFGLAENADSLDIVINEILFNPKTYGSDFVEIYNRSDKIIDLREMKLANLKLDTLSTVYFIEEESHLIFPHEYWVMSANPENVKQNYFTPNPENFIKMSMPSFDDKFGTALLLDKNNRKIDWLQYDESWHFPLLHNLSSIGVSLERIDFDRPTQNANNWHSASSTVGYATPSYQNSQYRNSDSNGDEIFLEPEVFSPDQDGHDDFLNIHYRLDDNGYTATIKIYDSKGRLQKNLVKNLLLATQGSFQWDGTIDQGEKARIGIYIVYAELRKTDGTVKKYKKNCVVAGKL